MKRLTLLRHGHAEAHAEGGDFDRALDARGRAEVARAAAAIMNSVGKPDLILVSTAQRTQQTAAIFCEHAGNAGGAAMRGERSLYHASCDELLNIVHSIADEITHLLLVGHNPGISELALRWANSLNTAPAFAGFATAGWSSMIFDSHTWSAIAMPLDGQFVSTPI